MSENTQPASYDPNARQDLMEALGCLPDGLLLLGRVYREISIKDDGNRWVQRADRFDTIEFRRNCRKANLHCQSLRSIFIIRADEQDIRKKFHKLRMLFAALPLKDEVVVAIASHLESRSADYKTYYEPIFKSISAHKSAVQNNIDLEAAPLRAEQEHREKLKATLTEQERNELAFNIPQMALTLPDVAALAAQNPTFGKLSAEAVRKINDRQIGDGFYPNNVSFWMIGRHIKIEETIVVEPKPVQIERPIFILLNSVHIAPIMRTPINKIVEYISSEIERPAAEMTNLDLERYLERSLHPQRKPKYYRPYLEPFYQGRITRPNGTLHKLPITFAKLLQTPAEDLYGIPFNPTASTIVLRETVPMPPPQPGEMQPAQLS